MEARCEAKLGKIYTVALKKEDKAVSHFINVVRLGMAMKPKDITTTKWYKEAKAAKDAITERRRLEEEAQRDKADAPFRAMVKTDLENVQREFGKGYSSFLKYLNEQYVPADKKIEITDENIKESNAKRLMQTKFSLIFERISTSP